MEAAESEIGRVGEEKVSADGAAGESSCGWWVLFIYIIYFKYLLIFLLFTTIIKAKRVQMRKHCSIIIAATSMTMPML